MSRSSDLIRKLIDIVEDAGNEIPLVEDVKITEDLCQILWLTRVIY
ncbi:hypothetical protein SAMN03159340_01860 [Sphingomonas sp. NFR15]|nr:hypothetical protein SAMN03159340_01860 [Sphingomonas sp. NFR15]